MLGNQPPLTTSQLEPNDENGQYYVCYRKSPSRPMPEPPIYVTEQRSSLSNPRNNAQPSMTDYQRATINEERSRSSPDKQRKSSLSAQDRDGARLQKAHSMLDEDNLNFMTRRKSDVQGSTDFAFAAGDDEADEARVSRRTSSLPLKTANSEFLPERRTTPYDEMFQEKLLSQRPSLKNQGGEVPQETPLDNRDRKAEIMNRPRSGYVDATPEHQQLLEKNLTSKTTPIRADDSRNRTSQELTAVSSSISDSTSTRESRERMMLEDLDADDNDLTATSQRRPKNEGRPDTDLPRQSQTLVKQATVPEVGGAESPIYNQSARRISFAREAFNPKSSRNDFKGRKSDATMSSPAAGPGVKHIMCRPLPSPTKGSPINSKHGEMATEEPHHPASSTPREPQCPASSTPREPYCPASSNPREPQRRPDADDTTELEWTTSEDCSIMSPPGVSRGKVGETV
uniref:Uncharacterized protein n=1 Tax=Biomphalaria glabrata TaxID=6526 RepID=A0A2C9L612_BIOGL